MRGDGHRRASKKPKVREGYSCGLFVAFLSQQYFPVGEHRAHTHAHTHTHTSASATQHFSNSSHPQAESSNDTHHFSVLSAAPPLLRAYTPASLSSTKSNEGVGHVSGAAHLLAEQSRNEQPLLKTFTVVAALVHSLFLSVFSISSPLRLYSSLGANKGVRPCLTLHTAVCEACESLFFSLWCFFPSSLSLFFPFLSSTVAPSLSSNTHCVIHFSVSISVRLNTRFP